MTGHQHNSPTTFSMAGNVVEMVWEWSSLWPFPHTDTLTHTFRSTSGSRSTSQPPSPSLTSPPWTALSCSLDGWHKRSWELLTPGASGSCILHLASFPDHSHLQYLITYSMQIRRVKA